MNEAAQQEGEVEVGAVGRVEELGMGGAVEEADQYGIGRHSNEQVGGRQRNHGESLAQKLLVF